MKKFLEALEFVLVFGSMAGSWLFTLAGLLEWRNNRPLSVTLLMGGVLMLVGAISWMNRGNSVDKYYK